MRTCEAGRRRVLNYEYSYFVDKWMNLLKPSCKFAEMRVLADDLDVSESASHPIDEIHDHGIDFILLLEALINRV